MNRIILATLIASISCACSTSSGVIKLSPDTYKVTSTAMLNAGGGATANKSAYGDAQATCEAQDKEMRVINEQSETLLLANINLIFRCVKKGSK